MQSSDDTSVEDWRYDIENMSSVSDEEETQITPFKKDPWFQGEALISFIITIGLLVGAHLNIVSIWWLFGFFAVTIVPSELNKVRKYGLWSYLEALHFERITVHHGSVIVGGLIIIIALLIVLVTVVTMFVDPNALSKGGHLMGDAKVNWWLLAGGVLLMYLVVGPLEELLFRHQLQGWMKKRVRNVSSAIIFTNLIFASLHLPMLGFTDNWIVMVFPLIGVFVLGCVFSVQYEYTDNLAVPSLTHSTYNSLVLTLLFASQHLI